MPAKAADSLLGRLLGERYLVRRKIGEGAMGAVYLADHVWLERPVAVKVVRSDAPVSARALRRLHREARAVARIRHPAVVAVYDYGETPEGWPFLVMEYVEGQTAARRFRGTVTLPELLIAADAALAGLAAAHARGVLHRDLKPANMLVRGGDPAQLVLLDFGIAAVIGDQRGDQHSGLEGEAVAAVTAPGQERLTRLGSVVGTPLYMSPEQAMGQEATHRSDIYAVGVILYEWLSGSPPFDGDVTQILRDQAWSEPPPLRARAGLNLPPALLDIVSRSLEKDPTRRWDDANSMRAALKEVACRLTADGSWVESAPSLPSIAIEPLDGPSWGSRTVLPALDVPTPRATERIPGDPPFVGRETEMETLRGLLSRTRAGRGGIVLLRGEPGVGKSRLCRHVLERVAEDGIAQRGRAAGDPSGGAPFAPLRALVEDLLELQGRPEATVSRTLARLARGDAGDALSEGERALLGRWLRPPLDGRPAEDDARLPELVERLFRALAQARPVLLWLDDAPCCGQAVARFLERLAHSLRIQPAAILLLVTLDDARTPASEPVADLLAGLDRYAGDSVTTLPLERLAVSELETIIAGVAPCSPELRTQVATLAGGSPLLAVQLVRHLLGLGRLIRGSEGWRAPVGEDLRGLVPASLEQLFRADTDRVVAESAVPARTRRLLETAALLGDSWDLPLLLAALEATGSAEARADVEESVDQLVAAGLFAEPPGGTPDRLCWDPALRRDAALAGLRGTRRGRRLGRAVADALLGWQGIEPGARARAVAELLLLAEERQAALPHLLVAGGHALSAGELAEAARLYRLVAEGSPDPHTQASAWVGVGDAEGRSGNHQAAGVAYRRAVGLAGDPTTLAAAWLGAGRAAWNIGDLRDAHAALLRAKDLLDGVGADAPMALRCRVLRTLAAAAADLPGATIPLPDPALSSAARTPEERCEAAKTLAVLAELSGDAAGSMRWFRDALDHARRAGLRVDVVLILVDLGRLSRRLGDRDRAATCLQEARALSRVLGLHDVAAEADNEWGELRRADGALGEAVAAYERAAERWTVLGSDKAALATLNLAVCAVEDGQPERAREALAAVAARGGGVPASLRAPWLFTSALAAAATGEAEEGRRLVVEAIAEEMLHAPPHDDAVAVGLDVIRHMERQGATVLAQAVRVALAALDPAGS